MNFFEDDAPATSVRAQFSRRVEVEPLKRQRGAGDEPVHAFTMRVRVAASNAFVTWCERERLSYREGFDRLMRLLEANPDAPVQR
jgi:hypothetical protein